MTEQRNLVFILADNHNSRYMGCAGHPVVRTPNLDAIARQGTRFAAAYCASPLCCPSRAALATGRYPHETGYWDNALAYDGRVPSWMHRLSEAGHYVAAIGKLHFKGSGVAGFAREIVPMHIVDGRGAVRNLLRSYGRGEPDDSEGNRWDIYFAQPPGGTTEYFEYDEEITRQAMQWLQEVAPGLKEPWALFVSYACPHPPLQAPKRLLDLYPPDEMPLPAHFRIDERARHASAEHHRRKFGTREIRDEKAVKSMVSAYCALVTHIDEQVGRVLSCVDAVPGPAPRVVYSSDHGDMLGAHGMLGKGLLYEDAVRVPLLMRGDGIPAGYVAQEPVSHVDLFPTILEAAGLGDRAVPDLPGRPLLAALRTGIWMRKPLFAEYHANFSRTGSFMLLDEGYKFVYHAEMPSQLFNLLEDPAEVDDLLENPSQRAKDVAGDLERKLREICDPDAVDRQAKSAQRALAETYGGEDAIAGHGSIAFTPAPIATGRS